MTNTTITNAANLAGVTPLLTQSPTKTVMQTTTTAVIVNIKLASGTEATNQSQRIRVYFATSPFALTADATLPSTLRQAVDYLDCPMPPDGGSKIYVSKVLVNNGANLYTWFDSPPTAPGGGTAGTITITSCELP